MENKQTNVNLLHRAVAQGNEAVVKEILMTQDELAAQVVKDNSERGYNGYNAIDLLQKYKLR